MRVLTACLSVLGLLPLGVLADEFDSWVEHSPLIFLGTVTAPNASTQPDLPPSERTVIVKVDRVFRTRAILGNLVGKRVTVLKAKPWSSPAGRQFIFFTSSLIYGDSLALRENGHYDASAISAEDIPGSISAALGRAAESKLKTRLDGAELVVVGKVASVGPVPPGKSGVPKMPEPYAPRWWQARVKVESVEKGRVESDSVAVVFPTARSWTRFPKFSRDQEGVWLLRRDRLPGLPPGALTALDVDDFSDKTRLNRIRGLITAK